jgi:transcriptional regulator with XRE-family HTH domain
MAPSSQGGPMSEIDLSKKVALLAKSQNITQKQIAEHCEISRITVHRFFSGKTEVRSSDFVKMVELMGINITGQLEHRLSPNSNGAASLSSQNADPLFSDIAIVLNNLKTTVRKALLEQILWWGQTSEQEPVLDAVNRLKKYIKENPSQLEEA